MFVLFELDQILITYLSLKGTKLSELVLSMSSASSTGRLEHIWPIKKAKFIEILSQTLVNKIICL